jgi:hypothetical protein
VTLIKHGLLTNRLVGRGVGKASVISLVVLALIFVVWNALVIALGTNTNISWTKGLPTQISYVSGTEGQILLPALADGTEVGPCLLDSGGQAKMILISPVAAKRAKLKILPVLPWSIVRGSYGSTGFLINRTAGEFQVGPLILRRPRLVETPDLETVSNASVVPPVGSFCSAAFFQAAIVDIDWRAQMISFHKPEVTPRELESIKWTPMVVYKGRPFVMLTVEGKHKGLFMIDTGMTSAIHFYSHAIEKYQLLATRTVGKQVRKGLGGSATVFRGQIQSVMLSHYRVAPVLASFDTVERHRSERGVSGRIGLDLLRHFRTIIDMPNNRVAFVAY